MLCRVEKITLKPFLLLLFLFFITSTRRPILAQQCASQVVVDQGSCVPRVDRVTGQEICEFEVVWPNQKNDCDPNTCETYFPICSSNDCLDVPDAYGNCYKGGSSFNCSPVSCGQGGGGGGGCSTTAPVITDVTWNTTAQTATVSYAAGANGNSHSIIVSKNFAAIAAGCQGQFESQCVTDLKVDNPQVLDLSSIFERGKIFYFRMTNRAGSCSKLSPVEPSLSSCLAFPNPMYPNEDENRDLISEVTSTYVQFTSPTNVELRFSSDDPSIASVNPASDTNYAEGGYRTTVTGVSASQTAIKLHADTYLNGISDCTTDTYAYVLGSEETPWWQVIDGDVTTNGNLRSNVPDGEYFGLPGAGGYPGIPAYGGSSNLLTSDVSALGWIAQSTSLSSKIFNYQFFKNQIPGNVIPTDALTGLSQTGAVFFGYEWFKYTGPVDFNITSSIDFGNRKVILLVENANLGINADITLTDEEGFFLAIVNGDINVNPAVTDLEGLYVADENFSTGTTGVDSDLPFYVRGSVAAYGGVNLQRDLADDALPAETFEYAPDQILLFSSKLGYRRMRWKEVAP